MAGRVREHDWASTPLGPIEDWPQCLKTVVDMMLSNGFAMTVLWGRDLIQIYNDAHRDLIADDHPGALGRPTREAWSEYWTQTAPFIERVWAGETLTFFDVPQTVTRRGTTEDGLVHELVQPPLGRHGRGRRRAGHVAGDDRTDARADGPARQ